MSTFNSFPISAANSTIAVTSTTGSIALPGGTGGAVLLKNIGSAECFVAAGTSSVTATAQGAVTAASDGSMSIPAGEIGVYSITISATHLAAICAAGQTTTLRVTRGEGA